MRKSCQGMDSKVTEINLTATSERVKTFEPILTLREINDLPPDQSLPMPKIFIGTSILSSKILGKLTKANMTIPLHSLLLWPSCRSLGYLRPTKMRWVSTGSSVLIPRLRLRYADLFQDAVVTRGAAGRMAPQLNNLLFLDHVLQFTDIMIIHHTGNSMSKLKHFDFSGLPD